jgi:hypothetical protein
MRLSNVQVTRIREELSRLKRNSEDRGHDPTIGTEHRAIESFVEVLVNEILIDKLILILPAIPQEMFDQINDSDGRHV